MTQGLRTRRLFIFCLFLGVSRAFAQPPDVGSISFTQDSYLSEASNGVPQRQFQFFQTEVSNLERPTRLDTLNSNLKGHVRAQVSPQVPMLNSLAVNQLYIEVTQFSAGRRKWNWSQLDEDYQLGVFQPLNNTNPLRPETQGLAGIFLQLAGAPIAGAPTGLLLMGSSLYIPDQQPGYEIRDGKFSASNPWFPPLPSVAQYDEAGVLRDPIRYDLQIPETQSIVFQNSYAAQAFVGESERGSRLSVSWAQKSANQMAMGVAAYSNVGSAVIPVRPQTFGHQLAAVDWMHRWSEMTASISVLREKPTAPEYGPNWTFNSFEESFLLSPALSWKSGEWSVRVSHLEISGGNPVTQGPMATRFAFILPERFPYQRAEKVELGWRRVWTRSNSLQVALKNLWDLRGEYSMWDLRSQYQFDRRWSVEFGILLVESSTSRNLFARYQNNDFASMGLVYAF